MISARFTYDGGHFPHRYKQVRALLQLAIHLAARDEDPCAPPADEARYAAALTSALGALLPVISASLLAYPKLCASYFSLLSTMLENRPLATVSMPPSMCAEAILPRCFLDAS
jgi:hypothetical protein